MTTLPTTGAFVLLLLAAGCAMTPSYTLAPPGVLPDPMPEIPIEESPYFARLQSTRSRGTAHERVKIQYLIDATRRSPFRYDRNGYIYDSHRTAKHLQKKYQDALDQITTAEQFIDDIATASSMSGRSYYALPGDGLAYRTADLLHAELERLEAFLRAHQRSEE